MQPLTDNWVRKLASQFISRLRRPHLVWTDLRLGILGVVVIVIALVATGVIYVLPLGKTTYQARLPEAGAVRVGDDVRVAGVPVGKVTELTLLPDHVDMAFTVAGKVFVGDQSSLDIRMLTFVGGHYVALTLAGTHPLGAGTIPADHVRLPYSLMQAFQDAAQPVHDVDGDTLRKNFSALESALTKTPDGLREMGTAIDSLMDIMVRQNNDISRTLALVDEYLTAITNAKSVFGRLIHSVDLVETLLIDKRAEIQLAIDHTGVLFSRIAAIAPSWHSTLQPMAERLAQAVPPLEQVLDRLGTVIDRVHTLGEQLRTHAAAGNSGPTIDQSAGTIQGAGLCIPVPGRSC
ncbi:MlaD family protein [Nocardia sp. CA2R105]|uniref:MlaD family protein n=1 Tax=Nocardia coffeae TaxID=2873381 RepID=UPI001CA67010|nr:MlaD family protein [Nocardia coffeae]MBY8863419.1 MlaD family protein [Nocardia coffeae]